MTDWHVHTLHSPALAQIGPGLYRHPMHPNPVQLGAPINPPETWGDQIDAESWRLGRLEEVKQR